MRVTKKGLEYLLDIFRGTRGAPSTPAARNSRSARLRPEQLEDRLVPTVAIPDPINVANDAFGSSVAALGSNILVGAEGVSSGRGAAYVYNTSGTRLVTINDPGGVTADNFGNSVAAVGTNILVGSYGYNSHRGAAYLYNSSGTPQHTFTDPGGTANDVFGIAVAALGSNILIGAYGTSTDRGAVYLYNSSGTLLHTFTDPNNAAFDYFGHAVVGVGSNVLVGSTGFNGGRGAAYLLNTSGTVLHMFTDPGGSTSDGFGESVATDGTNVLIGTSGGNAAYLYTTSGTLLATFYAPTSGANFGSSVAMVGSNVLVGAYGVGGQKGAAYLFSSSGALLQTLSDPNNTTLDFYGASVAALGNNLLIGAYGVNSQRGAVYYTPATATTLTSTGPNPSTSGQTVGFSGTVSGGVPNGEMVKLEDASSGNAVVATTTTTGGTGAFTFSLSSLSVGTHNLFAVYVGDTNYAASLSSQVTQVVNPIATTTTLTDTGPNPSVSGQTVGFTGTVSGGVPNGETVKLEDASNGNAVVATTTTTGGTGAFAFSVSGLLVGTHNLFAVYLGDTNHWGSQSSQVTQVVNPIATTTTLIDSGPNPSISGQAVGFTGTVSGGVPDGETVTLEDASNGNAVVATTTTTGGTGSFAFSVSGLLVGTHNLFAVYAGDTNHATSQSSQVTQVVNPIATTTTLTDTGPNPSTSGQAVGFTGTVSGGVPDGETVLLEDASNGNAVVATTTTTGGAGSFAFSLSSLSVGTHNLFAVFVGDTNYATSQSSQVTQVVN